MTPRRMSTATITARAKKTNERDMLDLRGRAVATVCPALRNRKDRFIPGPRPVQLYCIGQLKASGNHDAISCQSVLA